MNRQIIPLPLQENAGITVKVKFFNGPGEHIGSSQVSLSPDALKTLERVFQPRATIANSQSKQPGISM